MQNRQTNNLVNYAAMGARIRAARKAKKMTQSQVAQMCDISAAFFGHIERGTRIASVETLIMISKVLQVSLDILVYDQEEGKTETSREMLTLSTEKTPLIYDAAEPDTDEKKEYCYIRIERAQLEELKKLFSTVER